MRERTSLLVLIAAALVASALATLTVVGASSGTADACSVPAPWATASPAVGLSPGESFELHGWAFNDIGPLEPVPPPLSPDEPQIAHCNFSVEPMENVTISWHGQSIEQLAVVDGPDFTVQLQVPADAQYGPASLQIGDVLSIDVHVGPIMIEPPCPWVLGPDGTAQHECPPPPPCLVDDPCVIDPPSCPWVLGPDGVARHECPPEPAPCPVDAGADAGENCDGVLTAAAVPMGDVSCDGKLTILDAVMIARYTVAITAGVDTCQMERGEMFLPAADINGDGAIGLADAVFVAQCSAGLSNGFCPAP